MLWRYCPYRTILFTPIKINIDPLQQKVKVQIRFYYSRALHQRFQRFVFLRNMRPRPLPLTKPHEIWGSLADFAKIKPHFIMSKIYKTWHELYRYLPIGDTNLYTTIGWLYGHTSFYYSVKLSSSLRPHKNGEPRFICDSFTTTWYILLVSIMEGYDVIISFYNRFKCQRLMIDDWCENKT